MPREVTKRKQNSVIDEEAPTHPKKKVKANSSLASADSDDTTSTGDPPSKSSSSSNTLNLQDLLDFSSLEDEIAIGSRFDAIARVLMHEYQLVVGRDVVETAFEIQEMEFYLQKAVCHEDPFTHGSEEQKVSGRWYFHRAPRRSVDASRSSTSLTGYRGGTRKGMDLTIGGPVPRNLSRYFSSKSSLVSGPSLLVDKILELSGASSISELVETMWGGDTDAFNPPTSSSSSSRTSYLYLKRATATASALPKIHKSPRIGLDLSHPGTTVPNAQSSSMDYHPRVHFLPKLYRYYTRPEELIKGRPQAVYGFIHANLQFRLANRSLSGDKVFRALLAEGTGLKDALVEKYLAEFEAGEKAGFKHLRLCIGPNGKGVAGSATLYLKMMGALDAVLVFASARKSL
ncbi:hypothetical protein AN958_06439 [Leucoagaricus sp. SymC.cos]|nr:hypothetical protein AN958_06439 [Leucoagaricus sp. SymC.cos]